MQTVLDRGRHEPPGSGPRASAFYSGARCVLKVLDQLVEHGDAEELERVIRRHGRTIRVLQGKTPRKPPH
jgi:hypothetical protein